jgi:hypothetical protein
MVGLYRNVGLRQKRIGSIVIMRSAPERVFMVTGASTVISAFMVIGMKIMVKGIKFMVTGKSLVIGLTGLPEV